MSKIIELLSNKPFALIGHRGAAGLALENTISSIKKAVAIGVDIIEIDARRTMDDVIVAFHDEDLRRIFGISKKLIEVSYKELMEIDVEGERVPTLNDVLSEIDGKTGLYIEIKEPEITKDVLKIVDENRADDWVAIISFFDEALKITRETKPSIPTGLIYFKPPGRIFDAKKLGAKIVLPRWNIATAKANATAHRLKLMVSTWTVNDIDLARKMIERGVDGIATDYPDKLINLKNSI